jgi:hypothetical protein
MDQLTIKVSRDEYELILQALSYYGSIKEECDDLYDLIEGQLRVQVGSIDTDPYYTD